MTRKFESTNEIELKNKIAEMNKELKLLKEEYQEQSKHKKFLENAKYAARLNDTKIKFTIEVDHRSLDGAVWNSSTEDFVVTDKELLVKIIELLENS